MFELSDFYTYCKNNDVDIILYNGAPSEGVTIRDDEDYAVFLDFSKIQSTRSLKGVCYHEMGHLGTGALHKVSSPFETVERSEYRANRWGAENYLTEESFRAAFADGCTELWELADYFDLPEDDVKKAFTYWVEHRGIKFYTE